METISLKAGKAVASVQIMGGELISFIDKNGRERLWHGDPDIWGGHAPVLFPVVGSLKDNQTTIAGKPYTILKHGFARKLPYRIGRRGEDFVEMILESTPETKTQYPFDFTLRLIHTITEESFSTEYWVENQSGEEMPFCIGGHPGIRCPMKEGERFEDYQLVFPQPEDGENALAPGGHLITGTEHLENFHNSQVLRLDRSLFDARDALIFTNLKSRRVHLVHKDTGKGIAFAFPKFPVLGVWTMPHKQGEYLCLEPWQGMPGWNHESGRMEDKPYVVKLAPGAAYKTWYELSLID